MNIYFVVTIILSCSVPLFFCLINYKLANIIQLFDEPDDYRKFHKIKTPLTGGIIIYSSLFFFIFFDYLGFIFFNQNTIFDYQNYSTLIYGSTIFFLIGLIDDKKNIGPNIKLIFFIIATLILLFIDQNLKLEVISISILQSNFSIGNFSYFWTMLCFLLFVNALNMFDGINLQVSSYSVASIIYVIFFYSFLENILYVILFSLLSFLILNYSSKSFLGNSGSYFLGFLLGYIFIKNYNLNENIFADEIVLIMLIPGLDMMRLFFQRILKKKHPFSPDREHLHHYISNKYNDFYAFIIIFALIWIPVLFGKIFNIYFQMIIFQFFIYSSLVIYFKKKK